MKNVHLLKNQGKSFFTFRQVGKCLAGWYFSRCYSKVPILCEIGIAAHLTAATFLLPLWTRENNIVKGEILDKIELESRQKIWVMLRIRNVTRVKSLTFSISWFGNAYTWKWLKFEYSSQIWLELDLVVKNKRKTDRALSNSSVKQTDLTFYVFLYILIFFSRRVYLNFGNYKHVCNFWLHT